MSMFKRQKPQWAVTFIAYTTVLRQLHPIKWKKV